LDELNNKGQTFEMMDLEDLISSVEKWHGDRNLLKGSTDKDQVLKLIQEMGELSDNVCKGNDIRDDVGDMLVVLINIAKRNNLTLQECLEVAWNDIKDRKGKMVDGIFVKEGDS
jgi:NTP pyrophosphatase (non-canonical NTP hydrolase)